MDVFSQHLSAILCWLCCSCWSLLKVFGTRETKTQNSEWLNTQSIFAEEISSQSSCVYICDETTLLCFTLTEAAIEKLKQKDTFKWMNESLRGTTASSTLNILHLSPLEGDNVQMQSIHPSIHSAIRPFIHPSVNKVILESPVPQNRRTSCVGTCQSAASS